MKKTAQAGSIQARTSEHQGFTLIELLVVIAIIGLLASIILASLNTAQQKGRDARRVTDMQQIGQAMLINDSSTGTALTCTSGTGTGLISGCTGTGLSLSGYNDPSAPAACGTTKPTVASTQTCNYTVYYTGTATTRNYEVCAVLETGSGTLTKGAIYVASSTAGAVLQGCP